MSKYTTGEMAKLCGVTVRTVQYYWKHVSYLCPQCHTVFKPKKKEFFFASHTPATRKLTCPCCGRKGFCVETCADGD